MKSHEQKAGEPLDIEAQVKRLRECKPGLSAMEYKSIIRNTSTFDEAVEWAKAKLDIII
jgi:hypothetical protein